MSQNTGTDRRVNFAQEEPMTMGEKISHRMDQFKEMVSSGCCSCASRCPSVAIVLVLALVVLGILAAIPLTLMLTSSAEKMSTDSTDLSPYSIRHPKHWPKTDKIQFDDLGGISMTALFPPNVTTCPGFGFACTGKVHMVIPSSRRCDGIKDCEDGSDEENCKECQSVFSCLAVPGEEDSKKKKSKKTKVQPTLRCLTAEKLCDGVEECPDGSDEAVCTSTCSKDQFKCSANNVCLPLSAKCDGVRDCSDGSDEKDCNKCQKGAHKCGKQCVKASQVCDGVAQCADRSDEKQCDCKTCSGSDKALCDDGTCIMRSQVCDGKNDCSNGMDEEDCPGSCNIETVSKKQKLVTCAGEIYTEAQVCSGEKECEKACSKCHPKLAFSCPASGDKPEKCIKREKVCDGVADCSDGSDEKNCTPQKECGGNQFTCDRKCIEVSRRCDGVWDCLDKSDEKDCQQCPPGSIRCAADKKCLPSYTRCNGVAECSDGSDEQKCTCEECLGAHTDTYMCSESNRCLKRNEVCSPYSMCPNATYTDKAYCAALVLKMAGRFPY
ncbi:hypothetical protein CAEBREN_04069 [Caenorhabditis brenneri]|uniref:Uncharacterized protein n=1 Tax=Caenorhabditis brenneri TaxID=135651 RepID=G0N3U8_CAEBE|nr:hypothetical protein CAEBREN_04069 [Caenorhabditis brenneri]